MTRHKIVLLTGGLIILTQLFVLRDYIALIQWGQVKVEELDCTCPDETVLNGRLYLRAITPDSLKGYDLNYSEIYVTERPHGQIDLMGVDYYMLQGRIIGKDRVSENDPWHPRFRVDSWKEVDLLKDWAAKIIFGLQLLIFGILLYRTRH